MRVLHKPARAKGGLESLLKMRHTPELQAWNKSYDKDGHWAPTATPTEPAKRRRTVKGPE